MSMTHESPSMEPVPVRGFWFLRHGSTAWNKERRAQGMTDIPLDETGVAQARQAAVFLKGCAETGRPVSRIYSSPLSRAVETAEIVGRMLGVSVEIVEDIREASFGEREGQTISDWLTDWFAGRLVLPGAETFRTVRCRSLAAIAGRLDGACHPLFVSHGGVWRALSEGSVAASDVANAQPHWFDASAVQAGRLL